MSTKGDRWEGGEEAVPQDKGHDAPSPSPDEDPAVTPPTHDERPPIPQDLSPSPPPSDEVPGPIVPGDSAPQGPSRESSAPAPERSAPASMAAGENIDFDDALSTGPTPSPRDIENFALDENTGPPPLPHRTGPFPANPSDQDILDLDDEDLASEDLVGSPTTVTGHVLNDDEGFHHEENVAFNTLAGPSHISEGEEAISDTFRRIPETKEHDAPLPLFRGHFIGRSQQLSALRDVFLEARQQNRLSFVTLIGEPGSGKTRLAREFARSVRAAFSNVRVLWGEAASTKSRRYEALARAIEERVGIGRGDTSEDARDKIDRAVRESLPSKQHAEIAPIIARLLEVPSSDDALQDPPARSLRQLELRSYVTLRRFLQHDAESGPLLLCFDAMEMSTDDSVKLIHYLADGLQHSPVMILAIARPTIFRSHPNWGQGDFDAQTVEVERLASDEAIDLLCDLAHVSPDEMPAEIRHVTQDRLAGNPRAIGDFIRFLFESRVLLPGEDRWQVSEERLAEVSLPQTYEDILRARLRALPAAERSLLDKAAASGEVFWLDAVVALVRAAAISNVDPDGPTLQEIATSGEKTRIAVANSLNRLCDRGLIIARSLSSIIGEKEYRFAYAPIWDLAYEGIDDLPKQRYHHLIAQWLEARPKGRDEHRQALVAQHLEEAGDLRGAAMRYRRAADAARTRFANQKAIRLYESALACLGDTDLVTRLHLWHDLGSVYQHRGDFDNALDAFERMVRLGWVVASRPKAAVAFNKMGRVWRQKGNLNLALEYLQRSLEMFREAGDDRGVATSLDDIGQVQWMLGRYAPALDQSAEALEMRRQAGDKRSIAVSLSNIGNIEKDRGLFDEAQSCYSEALSLREEIGDHYGYVVSLNNLAALAYERGATDEARESWEKALSEAERIGAVPLSLVLLNNLGEIATKDNKIPEARERLEQALSLATEIDDQRAYIDVLRNLSLLELLEENPERARRYARECLNLARRSHLPDMVGKAQIALAEIAAQTLFDASAPSGANAAEGYFNQAIKVFRDMGNEAELAKALRRLGEYLVEQGKVANGSASLREAVTIFAKLGMPDATALENVLSDLDRTGPETP